MGFRHLMCAIPAFLLLAEAYRKPYKHEAVDVRRRQAGLAAAPTVSASITALPPGVLTLVTPRPGGSPVSVTEQSQIVTSYIPQFTLCELPPIEFFSISPIPLASRPTTAPYHNYSISIPPGNGSCTTIFSQTATMVCATTLQGLATTYPVTNCAQDITFSSQYGYTLVTPTPTNASYGNATRMYNNTAAVATITPGPSIQTLTTYYLAPWQELTAGTAPGDVIKVVCEDFTNGTECITTYQVWHTSLVSATATKYVPLNVSTTIHGPSQILVQETFVANVTELITTFRMSTTIEQEYQTHWTSTHKAVASLSTAPTVFETLTVEEVSSS